PVVNFRTPTKGKMAIKSFQSILRQLIVTLFFVSVASAAAAKPFKVSFKLVGGVNNVNCVSKLGVMYPGVVKNGKATATIPSAAVDGASCFALDAEGRLLGPVFAPKGQKGLLVLKRSS